MIHQQLERIVVPPPPAPRQLPVLSATKLMMYAECPRKYQWTYVTPQGEPGGESLYAINGSAIHKTIETYYTRGFDGTTSYGFYLNALMTRLRKVREMTEDIHGLEWYTPIVKSAWDILQRFDWDAYAPVQSEVEFRLPYPNADNPLCIIHGFMDQVYDWGIIDFKTSKKAPKPEALAMNLQFMVYAWAFEQLYKKVPEHVYWVHLRNGKWLDAAVQDKLTHLDVAIRRILSDTEFPATAWYSDPCRYCPFVSPCGAAHDERQDEHASNT